MHFENGRTIMSSTAANSAKHNTNDNHTDGTNNSISTTASCTSSTDSGVIISDSNTSTINCDGTDRHDDSDDSTRTSCKSKYNSSKNHPDNRHSTDIERFMSEHADDASRQQQQQYITKSHSDIKSSDIQIHLNLGNISNGAGATTATIAAERSSPRAGDGGENSERRRKYSPTGSIRSTTISIISIDENAIDSSVVDSDSELEADAEGVHSTYVVKKLGQQTTYAPNSAEIPDISKGLTVLSQTISPHIDGAEALPSSLLNGGAGVGAGSLMPLGNTSSGSGGTGVSGPQIGSIALTNSSDVTFGDKHFYEGPVTIQQFLIDNREKWKANDDGQDNPVYAHEQTNGGLNSKSSATAEPQQPQPYKYMFKRKTIIITGISILLIILIGVVVAVATSILKGSPAKSKLLGDGDDSRKNIPINSTIDGVISGDAEDCANGTLCVVSRDEWGARKAGGDLTKLVLPVHRVIISHTASEHCLTQTVCTFRAQVTQSFHMESFGWDDIGYNFLIGGDGRVYVGRGWYNQGAHTKGYNVDSFGIAFIGTFTVSEPTPLQLQAAKLLIEEAVLQQKLAPDYRLYGARQMSGTESPGEALYKIIKTWSHWSPQV